MPVAAHRCVLEYWGSGPSSFGSTNDTLTLISGTTYGISGIRKNHVLAPAIQIVKDGGVSIGTAFTVNHLAGQFTLNSAPSGAVTADINYFGSTPAFEVREFSINLSRDELEDTVFGDNNKSYLMGLKGGTGTISGLDILTSEWNTAIPPAGTYNQSIESTHNLNQRFIISVQFDPTSRRTFRAIVDIPSLDLSGARDGLVEGSFPFTISSERTINSPFEMSYSFFTQVA